jgi:hypothetical protein
VICPALFPFSLIRQKAASLGQIWGKRFYIDHFWGFPGGMIRVPDQEKFFLLWFFL